jgi:hypothetical protein
MLKIYQKIEYDYYNLLNRVKINKSEQEKNLLILKSVYWIFNFNELFSLLEY